MSRFAPLIITLTLAWLLIPAGPALAGDATPGIIYTGIAGLIAILGLTLALLKKKTDSNSTASRNRANKAERC